MKAIILITMLALIVPSTIYAEELVLTGSSSADDLNEDGTHVTPKADTQKKTVAKGKKQESKEKFEKECASYQMQINDLTTQGEKQAAVAGKKFQRELETNKELRQRWLASGTADQDDVLNKLVLKSMDGIAAQLITLKRKSQKCDKLEDEP